MILRSDRRHTARLRERFDQLVELAPDGILVHDGERVILVNASAVRLAGATTRGQVVGLPIDTLLDPPHLKGIEVQLTDDNSVVALAPPVRDTLHRLDGTDLQVEVRAVAFMDRGRLSAHLIVRDITERLAAEQAARQLEARLHEAQRMELVGTLAGGVAHEVNNMLQVISGFADFLLRDPRLSEDASEDVREIIKATTRAATVTRQLLAFGRRQVNRPEVLDLGVAVGNARAVLQRLLADNQQFTQTVGEAPAVSVDAEQLQQVIINLVLNARDAMADGGTLSLTTAATDVVIGVEAADGRIIPPGLYATLEVSDTGKGMDALLRTKIFEPFFTTKPIGRGTGLGLAAVLGVLRQNHCFIRVSSVLGMGSTFTVYLPAAIDHREQTPPLRLASVEKTSASATVLVVDDEHIVRAIAARILQHEGYRVIQAIDGTEAVQLIERLGPPHLVLTDVRMAGVSGLQLARRVRERWPTVPIVFMSGYSADELALQEDAISSARFLSKPFTKDDLASAVADTLARAGKHHRAIRAD
jgi:two-component system, cell cycle sensor histidine kinase and response regulator CckA